MSWVNPAEIIDSWVGSGVPTDTEKLQVWIDRAERLVRRHIKDLQERIDAEADLDPPSTELLDTARDVVVTMVTEVFKNPEGRRSIQHSAGSFSESTTFGGDNPGKLAFLREYMDLLSSAAAGEAFTVDLIGGHVEPSGTLWV